MLGQNIEVSPFPLHMLGSIHLGSDYLPLDFKTVVLGKTEFARLTVCFGFTSTRCNQ